MGLRPPQDARKETKVDSATICYKHLRKLMVCCSLTTMDGGMSQRTILVWWGSGRWMVPRWEPMCSWLMGSDLSLQSQRFDLVRPMMVQTWLINQWRLPSSSLAISILYRAEYCLLLELLPLWWKNICHFNAMVIYNQISHEKKNSIPSHYSILIVDQDSNNGS